MSKQGTLHAYFKPLGTPSPAKKAASRPSSGSASASPAPTTSSPFFSSSSSSASKPVPGSTLTPEQRQRIEQNRRAAEAKLKSSAAKTNGVASKENQSPAPAASSSASSSSPAAPRKLVFDGVADSNSSSAAVAAMDELDDIALLDAAEQAEAEYQARKKNARRVSRKMASDDEGEDQQMTPAKSTAAAEETVKKEEQQQQEEGGKEEKKAAAAAAPRRKFRKESESAKASPQNKEKEKQQDKKQKAKKKRKDDSSDESSSSSEEEESEYEEESEESSDSDSEELVSESSDLSASEEEEEEESDSDSTAARKRRSRAKAKAKARARSTGSSAAAAKKRAREEEEEEEEEEEDEKPSSKQKKGSNSSTKQPAKKKAKTDTPSLASKSVLSAFLGRTPSKSSSGSTAAAASPRTPASSKKSSAAAGGASSAARRSSAASAAAAMEDDDSFSVSSGRKSLKDATGEGAGGEHGGIEPWLLPENIKDKYGRRPGHPDYDPRTVFVPPEAWKKMTPAQKQYWTLKQDNFDVILFFKMGKFYELFDYDAEIGVKELGLCYMKNSARPHAGFPEAAYTKYADQLVRLGYKVGRVEQVETPQQLEARNRSLAPGQKKDKVVARRMCQILSPGTLTDSRLIGRDDACYLLSICESSSSSCPSSSSSAADSAGSAAQNPVYGVCFIDTATGHVFCGQFEDDRMGTRLRTLLAQIQPKELLFPREGLSQLTRNIFRNELRVKTMQNPLQPKKEFWDAETTLYELRQVDYFAALDRAAVPKGVGREAEQKEPKGKSKKEEQGDEDGQEKRWPPALRRLKEERRELALSALGGAIWYLRRLLLDEEVFSLGLFHIYDPTDTRQVEYMALDGQTLLNLEILENSEGGTEGTLLKHVDKCVTAFGRRLLRNWLTRPLAQISAINERLNAVEDLMNNEELRTKLQNLLRQLPDLERLLSRIFANGLGKDAEEVMYGDVSRAKVEIFLKVLKAFEDAQALLPLFKPYHAQLTSARLRALTSLARHGDQQDADGQGESKEAVAEEEQQGGLYPDLEPLLQFFKEAFDREQAKKAGFILPFPGVDAAYDNAVKRVKEAEAALEEYLESQRKKFKNKKIQYHDRGKEKYQLEIPVEALEGVRLGDEYELKSETKKVKRYWTPTLRELAEEMERAMDEKTAVLKDITRLLFVRFCRAYQKWMAAVQCLAELDCLCSLAITSSYQGDNTCRPQFVSLEETGGEPLLELRNAVHPCLISTGKTFIPNDTVLGTAENPAKFVLVSGPNMGGKSTLLRQTCACVILAQLGCYVPAESCRLTPIDRIFTRVGANDRIMQGQSTFLVELEETANILRHATKQSLVILDELGRGTSTFDGTAIAYSVVKYLKDEVGCLVLFSTHYHMLLEEFRPDPRVALYHMAAHVDPEKEDVTFMYKFQKGISPKSYGMNVARLAGMPESVVGRAALMAEAFESRLEVAHALAREARQRSKEGIQADRPEDVLGRRVADALARKAGLEELMALQEEARRIIADGKKDGDGDEQMPQAVMA